MNSLGGLVGESPGIAALRETIGRLLQRQTDARRLPAVLIQGETGTGKGLVARALHRAGPRAEGPFVDVNCAAIPETLLEAEMFGFERGAFTDARQAKRGLFQAAHRGTIFLDEVGLLPESLQGKLLKVIEEKSVRRLGSTRSESVDVWVITATSENLVTATRERRFRGDLYHRLAVLTLWLPPLRERGHDILLLAEHFLARACVDYGLPPKTLDPEAREALLQYPWPGNVRELANVMERVVLLTDTREVTAEALGLSAVTGSPAGPATVPLADAVGEVERAHVLEALREANWNISRAAARLGIPRNTLRYRMEKHRLQPGAGPVPRARPAPRSAAAAPAPSVPAAAPVPGPPAARGPSTIRWERRRVSLLRVTLVPRGEDPDARDTSRPLALSVEKIRTFGGRVLELGRSGLVAAFGLDPAEDAPTRAAHAALAIHRAVEREREGGAVGLAVRSAVHVGQFPVARVGGTTDLDHEGKQSASEALEALVAGAEPGAIHVSAEAAPFLQRRFELLPVAGEGVAGRAYRLGRGEPTGLPRRLARFVGRQHELGLLRGLLASAARGQGHAAGIVGDAGMGKSRLLLEFRRSLEDEPITYLEGHCVSYGSTIPYLPVLDLLRGYCGITDADTPEAIRAKVRAVLAEVGMDPEEGTPYLTHLLGVKAGAGLLEGLTPEVINARALEALRQMTLRGSRRRPLVLAVEDLHWIDRTSEEYLSSLVESLAGSPALFVATYRPGYRPPWLGESYTTQIALPPLAPSDGASVVRSVLEGGGVADAVVELILAKAEGNPLFLEELARAVREQGGVSPTVAVPDTVEEVLRARIDWLPAEERELLERAAVIGKDVPFVLLAAVSDLPEPALRRGLAALRSAEFVHERVLSPDLEYTFKHPLIQEVAYESLPPERRRALHGRIVEAMEARYPGRLSEHVEQLAHHAFRGQAWEKAVGYLRQAGAQAAGRSAHREAVGCFERALEALLRLPPGRARTEQDIDLRFDLRNSLFPLGNHEGILGHLREAEALAEALGDRRRLGWALGYRSHCLRTMGRHGEATEAGRRALTVAGELGDGTLELETGCYLGQAYYLLGDYSQAASLLRRCVASLAGELIEEYFGLPALPSVFSRTWLAWCLAEQGTFAEAHALAEEAVRIAEGARHPYSLTVACYGLGGVRLRSDDLPGAIAVLERGRALGQAEPLPMLFTVTSLHLGYAYALAGRPAEGLRFLEAAVGQVAAMGTSAWHSLGLAWLGEARWLAGRADDALARVGQALDLFRSRGERGHQGWALRLLGEIHARPGGDPEAAEAFYREAIARARELGMPPLEARSRWGLGVLYRRAGRLPEARALLSAAVELFGAMGMASWRRRAEGELAGSV